LDAITSLVKKAKGDGMFSAAFVNFNVVKQVLITCKNVNKIKFKIITFYVKVTKAIRDFAY
jgi:hypothetical protein